MSPRKVLLIDDEPDIRTVGGLSLEKVGKWETILASGGAEGIEKARSERPDVILLDVMMPDLDGPSVLERLSQLEDTRNIPVIFMTAKAQTHEVERFLALGAAGVVPKPFDPVTLPDEVRAILERWAGPGSPGGA